MSNLKNIAEKLKKGKENIILIYAFNATGKTRLSVAYKDLTKNNDGEHTGVYYNAYSEDLFVWDNDEENDNANVRLTILSSSLNKFHSQLNEDTIKQKLQAYNLKFDFRFETDENPEKGIKSITFFLSDNEDKNIKISRGEERIFIWCFFLALFDIDDWSGRQSEHFFIDDPVSSLDEHNIFVTAVKLLDLIENNFNDRKIILTTHHIGIYFILANWLVKGDKKDKFKNKVKTFILNKNQDNQLTLGSPKKDVFLYHLHLLQKMRTTNQDELYSYYFVLLRQVLENIASFLGRGNFGFVLEEIGIDQENANILNVLSHKNLFHYESDLMGDDGKKIFNDILDALFKKYNFQI